jgi:hypothetical protein
MQMLLGDKRFATKIQKKYLCLHSDDKAICARRIAAFIVVHETFI